jgi:hypothetical protein
MKSRPLNRGLAYLRRSDDGQEASLKQQFDWAKVKAKDLGVQFRGTYADVEKMQQNGLHCLNDIFLDDAISGGDLTRPGLQAFLSTSVDDKTVSHVLAFKRDRLGRPQALLEMMTIEQRILTSGVSIVTSDRIYTPEDMKENEITYLIGGLVEYQQHGKFSPLLGERIVLVQRENARRGFSTGGRAPYGFGRALVDANDVPVQWLEDGETIRRPGHHVRFLPKDFEKIAIWCQILKWRGAGDGWKRIAARLNQMGIPSPDQGRTRRDQGKAHLVSGKWNPNTIREMCTNPIIVGLKEYGKRSEGRYRRSSADGPRELEEHDMRPDGQPKLIENPEKDRVRAASGGKVHFDQERWNAIQPKKTTLTEGRKKGGRKATNPDRYPLATRVVDLTEGCGSVMHGTPYGKKLKYVCGRYSTSGYSECHHNTVEVPVVTAMLINALVETVDKAGGREAIRQQLLQKARKEAAQIAVVEEPPARVHLQKTLATLDEDIATAERRMSTEKNDARYEAIAKTFDCLVAEKEALSKQLTELAAPATATPAPATPEQQVDALMAVLDDLGTLATNPNANQLVRQLVLRLGIFVGLDFEEGQWGKRKIRKLRRAVIAFGEEHLPVPLHGRLRVGLPYEVQGIGDPHHDRSTPACCRGPAAEHGSTRGDGTVVNRPNESSSKVEKTHQGSNVGATGLEPATS